MESYTYRATTESGSGLNLDNARFVDGDVGVVIRSDGKTVWRGNLFCGGDSKRRAQFEANQSVGGFRRYLAKNGRCWRDDQDAARATRKEWDDKRRQLIQRLQSLAAQAVNTLAYPDKERTVPPEGHPDRAVYEAALAIARAEAIGPYPT